MTVHPDIPAAEATSVTHYLCPEGPTRDGKPDATHHLVPKRAGSRAGEPVYEQVCSYCSKTEEELRAALSI
jgi:hypothetical protein